MQSQAASSGGKKRGEAQFGGVAFHYQGDDVHICFCCHFKPISTSAKHKTLLQVLFVRSSLNPLLEKLREITSWYRALVLLLQTEFGTCFVAF